VKINFKVNGKQYGVDVEPRTLLVHLLRDHLRLTGTHIGCVDGKCGCCTVIVNGVSVKSCMIFSPQIEGCEITTIEGLSDGAKLHPIQESFWENHALECGYCTPGMVMAAYSLLSKIPNPSVEDVKKYLSGNLCRCTGYTNIIKAVTAAAEKMKVGSKT
jgi:carbon-monoxide dehydrogenase small subunit